MPEVDQRIAGWRAAAAPLFRGREEVLDELESHLREEVDRQLADGATAEDAVSAATCKLGDPRALATEFARVPAAPAPWLPVRLTWATAAGLAVAMAWPLAPRLAEGGERSLLAAHMGAVMLGYVGTLLVGLLSACYLVARLFREPRAGQRTTLRRATLALSAGAAALTGAGILLGAWCPFEKSGWCFGLDTREVGGLTILAWNLVTVVCFWRGRHSDEVLAAVLLGVAGNAVVVLGWLGAACIEGSPQGAFGTAAVVALTLGQLAFSCTALAPAGWARLRKS